MASAVAMAGIVSSTTPALNSSASASKLSPSSSKAPAMLPIRASVPEPADPCSRRALLSLLAAATPAILFAKQALADATTIKVEGPPPPFGGLPGTENADQARDTDLPLKERFYIQPLPPAEAAARARDSAKDIVNVKSLIDKKAWPYVQNDLRLKATCLRYDINTVVATQSKSEKKALKPLIEKVFEEISNLDYAARSKNVDKANKYYSSTVSSLNNLLSKLG